MDMTVPIPFVDLIICNLLIREVSEHSSLSTSDSFLPIEMPYSFRPWCYWMCHILLLCISGQVGLGVGSWPSNRATEG